jgi:hypothetical protein
MVVCGCPSKSRVREFYAWEKTPEGQYKQVRKNYFMNEPICKDVVDVLNAMSTKQPVSSWILSHTTNSTFECWPADVLPSPRLQELSAYSDQPGNHVAQVRSSERSQVPSTDIGLQEKCAKQAELVFKRMRLEHNESAVYTNHFSQQFNKCFVEVYWMQTLGDVVWTYKVLIDAYENKTWGDYCWHSDKEKKYWEVPPIRCLVLPDGKEISAQSCKSEAEFDELVSQYMEN